MKKIHAPNIISTNKEKRIFILGCLLLITFFIYRGVYLPLMNAKESLEEKVLLFENQIYKSNRVISQVEPFQKEYLEATKCYKQALSDKQELSNISSELQSIAQRTQLKITADLPKKSKATLYKNDFTINLLLEGNSKNILEFLYALQNCPHLYNVNELRIFTSPSNDSQLQCQLVLTKSLIK